MQTTRTVHGLIFCPRIGPFHTRLVKDFHFVAVLNIVLKLWYTCSICVVYYRLTKVNIMKSLFCSIETPIWDTFYTPRGFVKSSLIRGSDFIRDLRTELYCQLRLLTSS